MCDADLGRNRNPNNKIPYHLQIQCPNHMYSCFCVLSQCIFRQTTPVTFNLKNVGMLLLKHMMMCNQTTATKPVTVSEDV